MGGKSWGGILGEILGEKGGKPQTVISPDIAIDRLSKVLDKNELGLMVKFFS